MNRITAWSLEEPPWHHPRIARCRVPTRVGRGMRRLPGRHMLERTRGAALTVTLADRVPYPDKLDHHRERGCAARRVGVNEAGAEPVQPNAEGAGGSPPDHDPQNIEEGGDAEAHAGMMMVSRSRFHEFSGSVPILPVWRRFTRKICAKSGNLARGEYVRSNLVCLTRARCN